MARDEGKKRFYLYCSQFEQVKLLSNEQAGILFKLIYEYTNDLNPSEPNDAMIKLVWAGIKTQLKEDLESYRRRCESNRANVQRRWDSESIQSNTNEYECIPTSNDKIDMNREDKNIIKEEIKEEKTKRFVKPSVEEIEKYIKENNFDIDAEDFYNFYESKGWVIGKSPMKNWHSAMATWVKKRKETGRQAYKKPSNSLVNNTDENFF